MLNADQLTALLPSVPSLASDRSLGSDLVLERYRHPPSTIEVPGSLNHLLVIHLVGPIAVEEHRGRAGWLQRWTGAGDVSVTPAGAPVRRRFQSRPEVLLLQLAPRLVTETAEELLDVDTQPLELTPCFSVRDEILDRYSRLLASEIESPIYPGQQLAQELLQRSIALALLRRHSSQSQRRLPDPILIAPARLRRVIDYLQENSIRNPTLKELADLCGLSPTYFARAFRATTGLPPHRYIIRMRIAQARALLENTGAPISDIAVQCGFEYAGSFSTVFRNTVGVTPRQWRRDRCGQ